MLSLLCEDSSIFYSLTQNSESDRMNPVFLLQLMQQLTKLVISGNFITFSNKLMKAQ